MVIDFSTYYDFPRGMDNLFDEMWRTSSLRERRISYPPVNISEAKDALIVSAELPGLDTEDVELTLNEKTLIIRGVKKNETGTYYRQERPTGSFQRIVNLNISVQADAVNASMKNGVLRVVLPKAQENRPFNIAIEAQ